MQELVRYVLHSTHLHDVAYLMHEVLRLLLTIDKQVPGETFWVLSPRQQVQKPVVL